MKKFHFLFPLLLLAVPFLSHSQNVGVDVVTPLQKLDVLGGLRIGNTSNGVAGSIRWTGTDFQVHDGTQWITFGTGTDLYWTLNGSDIHPSGLVGGNVGIGTTTPATKLQVVGTARVSVLNVNGNYTLPTADGGAGFVLSTDGAGAVSWTDPTLVGDITSVVAGSGLINGGTSGNVTLDVNPGDGIVIVGDAVQVSASALEGNGLSVSSNNLDVNTDNSTLEINADILRIKADGVTAAQIATGAVTTTEILDGTILTGDISVGGVTSSNILNGTVQAADMESVGNNLVLSTNGTGVPFWQTQTALVGGQAGDGLIPDVPNNQIDVNVDNSTVEVNADVLRVKTGGITSLQILDATILTGDISAGGVTSTNILDGTIATGDISTGGVTTGNILNGTILPADIANAGNNQLLITDGTGVPAWQNQNSLFAAQAGDGLVTDGTNMDVNPGDGIAIISDQVTVNATQLDGNGIVVNSNNFDVNVDNSTLEINTDVVRVKASGILSSHIAPDVIVAADIATGGVATDEILNATILPADVAAGAVNTVLSTNSSGVVGWNNPATLTTVLQDRDADTRINVDNGGSPDDDHIRMTTVGVERMTIDNAGFVGIGENTPNKDLHVVGVTGGQVLVSRNDGTTTAGETLGDLLFDSEDDTDPSSVDASAVIRGIAAEAHGNVNKGGDLAFLTKGIAVSGSAAATERMRITNAGNVGIGLTNPSNRLHVYGTGPVTIQNAGEADINFIDNTNSQNWQVGTNANGFYIYDNAYRFTVKPSTGNIYLNNKHAFSSDDSWLRLNQSGEFASGTYTPGHLRADGGFTSGGSGSPGAGNIRATALGGGGNRFVMADNNGTLYSLGTTLVGTGLGDNLGNHTATTTLNMNNNFMNNFGRIEPYGIGGNSGNGDHAYAIFQEGGAWSYPYPDLRIAYHTGIKLGANPSYNGIRFYNDYNMATQTMSVGDGDNNVRIYYDLRVPFIYDLNDFGYYLDPNSSSRMSVNTTNENYTYGWFRNHNVNTGLYNQSTGNHWYSNSSAYWNIGGNNGTNTGIIFRNGHQGAIQGYTYSDGSGFGLLHSGGGWNYRTWNGGQEMYGQTLAGWSGLYANIMYDRDNSGYYVDPHSNTYINAFQNNNTLLGWPGYNGMTQSYGNYVWPGRNDGSGAWWQQSWYLAGNSSYGLYTNTGMYFAGATYHQNGGAFGGTVYNRDWGVGAGTTYGKVYSNWDNWGAGGLTVSDDGGFYDYNDGWIQFQGSNGIQMSTSSGSYFMLFRTDRPGCCYDKQIIPQNGNWGYIGTGGNYWYRMYAGGFVNASTRETKRDIMPLNDPTYELVMNDIDKIKPSFYKYHEELDELVEGKETKYRPNYHLGVITDESPDYIQDESFKGIDVYAIATMGIAGVKYNRAEIKEIKAAVGISEESVRLQDFGSFSMVGNEMNIAFRDDFASKLSSNTIPVITLTVNKLDVNVAISRKNNTGFTIIASGNTNGLTVDYMAVAEVATSKARKVSEAIPSNLMKGLVVDEGTKAKIKAYWDNQKEALEASIVPGSKPDHIPSEGEHPVPHAADPNVIIQGPVANPDESVIRRAEEGAKTYVPVLEDQPARSGYLPDEKKSKEGAPLLEPVKTPADRNGVNVELNSDGIPVDLVQPNEPDLNKYDPLVDPAVIERNKQMASPDQQ